MDTEKRRIRLESNYIGLWDFDGCTLEEFKDKLQQEYDNFVQREKPDATVGKIYFDYNGDGGFYIQGERLETDAEYERRVNSAEVNARLAKEARYKKYLELHKEFGE